MLCRNNPLLFPVGALLLAGLSFPAAAQVTCTASTIPRLARTAGNTEPVGDIVLSCTGGSPTPAGSLVPQINLTLFLNTNVTSLVTEHSAAGPDFSEALLLIDEPNRGNPNGLPATPLLNCGNIGAPDNGPLGPGICEIISTGDPTATYDGTQFTPFSSCTVVGATFVGIANYGCGRPNAFQGFVASSPELDNVINFKGIPFDPPGPGATRTLRVTNIRANAAVFGAGGPHVIEADIAESGSTSFTISPTVLSVAFSQDGLIPSALPGFVHLEEGYATAFTYKNVALALANATPGPIPYPYIAGDVNYPADAAQNVPGLLYLTEGGFEWLNNGVNAPPSPNPPPGYASSIVTTSNFPLFSAAYGGLNTGIAGAGVASAGTRIAVIVTALGESVTVPNVVNLFRAGSPGPPSGVMVATITDPNGAGPFVAAPGTSTTLHNFGEVVYEVLYSDPFAIEFANVPVSISGPLHEALIAPLLAPFYVSPDARFETPTTAHPAPTAIPRFGIVDPKVIVVKSPPGSSVP
jgi:hypothetical protein